MSDQTKLVIAILIAVVLLALIDAHYGKAEGAPNLCDKPWANPRLLQLCASDDPFEWAYGWDQGYYCHPLNGELDGCKYAAKSSQAIGGQSQAGQGSGAKIPAKYRDCARITDHLSGVAIVNCLVQAGGIVDLREGATGAMVFRA